VTIAAVLANESQWHVENIDVFSGCRALPASSVHCIVSSPPYLGLRDYGIPPRLWPDGLTCCYGLEPDVASYVRHTVMLFEDFRRVLRDDGVIWWNLGDSFSSDSKWGGKTSGKHIPALHGADSIPSRKNRLKDKPQGNKLLIPHRVAIALQDAGWMIRQDNVWHKKNPMSESVRGWYWSRCRIKAARATAHDVGKNRDSEDRRKVGFNARWKEPEANSAKWIECPGCEKCLPNGGYVLRRGAWRHTNAHEYVLQITKTADYFCDGQAAHEAVSGTAHSRGNGINPKCNGGIVGVDRQNASYSAATNELTETRNPRSVWSISSECYRGAHFAVFPSDLVRRCLAGSLSAGGCCPGCGSQYAPRIARDSVATRPGLNPKVWRDDEFDRIGQRSAASPNRDPQRKVAISRVEGYYPTCTCAPGPPVPPIVLEPFTGSGTTIQVARHMGFRAIGFEVNPAYIELAKERIVKVPRCFMPKAKGKKSRPAMKEQGELFQ
jgi:DNA modification methylase